MIPPVSEVPSHSISEPTYSLSPRIQSLDVIRGIGILGALFVSIWIFGGFTDNQQNDLLLKSKGTDYRLFGMTNLLLTGKMKALIAIVFGAGMILFMSKKNPKGQAANADLFMSRQMWLVLFGLINAIVFLWTGDMLFHFGIMGILLFPFIRLSKKGLLIASAVAMLIFCGKNYWKYADDKKIYNKYVAAVAIEKKIKNDSADRAKKDSAINGLKNDNLLNPKKTDTISSQAKKDTLTKDQQEEKTAWEGLVAGRKYDPKKDDGNKKSMQRISYGKLWNHLLPSTQFKEAWWTYTTGIWDFAAMILLGMALLKFGFFNNRLKQRGYLLLAVAGLSIGLLLGWVRLHNNQIALQDYAKYIDGHSLPHTFFYPIEIASMAIGYISLLLFLTGSGAVNSLWRGLASVGKLALTNYLMQTVLCSLFFTGFGMGYYGRLNQTQLYLIAGEICFLQIAFSVLWLRSFQFGPAEWLLRSLMYKRWLPNKIKSQMIAEPPMPTQ